MATPNTPTFNKYYGNGSTTEFSISFPYSKEEYVKVYVKRTGLEEVVVPSTEYEFVNESTIRFPSNTSSLDVLREGDVITIQRETTVESGYDFSNQKRLFPEDVMGADDLAFQILQEQARQLGRSIVFGPTSNITPQEVLNKIENVYDNIDNISNVSYNMDSVRNVSNNMDDVNSVSDQIVHVENASNNMPYIIGVENNMLYIRGVYNGLQDVTVVSRNIDSVYSVSGKINSVTTVADNDANIRTVSTNIDSVKACSTDMDAIKDAPNQAARAKQYADKAETLTEGIVKYSDKENVVGWVVPDRSNAVTVNTGSSYTAPSHGWLYVNITGQQGTNEKIVINIGGIQYSYGRSLYDNQLEDITAEIFVSKGEVCTFSVTGSWTVKFIPCKQ